MNALTNKNKHHEKVKKITVLVVLFLSTLSLINCETKNDITPKEDSVNVTDIGILHNKAMDEIFQTLKKEEVPLKSNNIDAVVKKGIKSFFDKETFSNRDEMISMSNKYYDNNRNKRYSKSKNLTDEITPELRKELNKLDALVDEYLTEDRNGSLELFDLSQTLKNNVPDNLTDENSRDIWVSAVDVMGHSAKYWNENYIKWQELSPNQGNDKSLLSKSLKCRRWWCGFWRVVRADIRGAVKGGITGAFTGNLGTGALAGGLVGSAGQAIDEIWPSASAPVDGPSENLGSIPLDSIPGIIPGLDD